MNKNAKSTLVWVVMASIFVFALSQVISRKDRVHELRTSSFYQLVEDRKKMVQEGGRLAPTDDGLFKDEVIIKKEWIQGTFRDPLFVQDELQKLGEEVKIEEWKGQFKTSRDQFSEFPLHQTLKEAQVSFNVEQASNFSQWFFIFATTVLPIVLFIGIMIFFMRQVQGTGNRALSFGKSRARLHSDEETKITFADVAGVDEAKEALQEVIEFLKDPKKFQRLGGRIPKGVLLMGPPGTGKTMLARAVAGEANVPFYSISGSDFVEMFVGVGASRVRDCLKRGRRTRLASYSSMS